jgi:hypothetical protein
MSSKIYLNMYLKYKKKYYNNCDTSNIYNKYKPKIIKRIIPAESDLSSVLGKRNYGDAFEQETYDDLRYKQHIDLDYFVDNIGHPVVQNKK